MQYKVLKNEKFMGFAAYPTFGCHHVRPFAFATSQKHSLCEDIYILEMYPPVLYTFRSSVIQLGICATLAHLPYLDREIEKTAGLRDIRLK